MPATDAHGPTDAVAGPWIHTRRFDLLFLTLSGVVVFLPYLSYGFLKAAGVSGGTSSLIVGLTVTLLVGGPHMYSTYLRTTLEPAFRKRWGLLTYAPIVVIPALVVLGSIHAFVLLLTFFFFWASLHVTHQAQYISETYRLKAGARPKAIDRWLDGAVILGALYVMAMYKLVAGQFLLARNALFFPTFLQKRWFAIAFTVGYVAFFLFYVARTLGEIRRGETRWPRLIFMAVTVSLAFVVPLFDNLDIAFQGFNTWHSLQYLALTWFILGRNAERGAIGNPLVAGLAGGERTGRFYLSMVGATVAAGTIYLFLWKGLGFAQDKSYFVVVLSFLLVHYFYDHILFRDFEPFSPISAGQRRAMAA